MIKIVKYLGNQLLWYAANLLNTPRIQVQQTGKSNGRKG